MFVSNVNLLILFLICEKRIIIQVRSFHFGIFSIVVKKEDTILDIKNEIKYVKGINIDIQRLIFKGKEMVNDQTLDMHGIDNNQIIHMVIDCSNKKKHLDNQKEEKENNHSENQKEEKENNQVESGFESNFKINTDTHVFTSLSGEYHELKEKLNQSNQSDELIQFSQSDQSNQVLLLLDEIKFQIVLLNNNINSLNELSEKIQALKNKYKNKIQFMEQKILELIK